MAKRNFGAESFENSQLMLNMARNIETIIKDKEWTYTEAAHVMDVSTRYIAELINGKANITILLLERIASRLGLQPLDLMREYPTGDVARSSLRDKGQLSSGVMSHGHDAASADFVRSQQLVMSSLIGLFERLALVASDMSALTRRFDSSLTDAAELSQNVRAIKEILLNRQN
jgi:DNA-binding Xre family transcriptional regulator